MRKCLHIEIARSMFKGFEMREGDIVGASSLINVRKIEVLAAIGRMMDDLDQTRPTKRKGKLFDTNGREYG